MREEDPRSEPSRGRLEGSGAAGEPLHQPPNPVDLERHPPACPQCARVRGLMRDFVDGDLGPVQRAVVEEHVHLCRACALALVRAEHERMVVRQALAEAEQMAAGELPVCGWPSAQFCDEVMAALFAECEAAEEPAAGAVGGPAVRSTRADAAPPGGGRPSAVGRSSSLLGVMVLAACLITVLVVVQDWLFGGDIVAPQPDAQIFVTSSDNTQGLIGGRSRWLQRGWRLREEEMLLVGKDGAAEAELHDATELAQPAATLQFFGNAAMLLRNGKPLLVRGEVVVDTNRELSVAFEDGSRLDLGQGSYRLTVEDRVPNPRWDPLAGAAGELRIGVEVLAGDGAHIVREGRPPFVVSAGKIGQFESLGAEVALSEGTGAGAGAGAGGIYARGGAGTPATAPTLGSVEGIVVAGNGAPMLGANVWLWTVRDGTSYRSEAEVDANGWFRVPLGGYEQAPLFDAPYAIVGVFPSANFGALGDLVPDALPLLVEGEHARLDRQLVCRPSVDLIGEVVDESGAPVQYARLVPCVVDELLGTVLPLWHAQDLSYESGSFRLRRLPVELPWHQALVLVVFRHNRETVAVPVPARGGSAAPFCRTRVVMRALREARIVGLAPNSTVEIWQDVTGLPGGSAARTYTRETDERGEVVGLLVESGQLWVRSGPLDHGEVRRLDLGGGAAERVYAVGPGPWLPEAAVFRTKDNVPGTELRLASSYRHQTCGHAAQENGLLVTAVETSRWSGLDRAQVFALSPSGPRGSGQARFLGFTSPAGALAVGLTPGENAVLVIGPQGEVAIEDALLLPGSNYTVYVRETGTLRLENLPASPLGLVPLSQTVVLEQVAPAFGLKPRLTRFTCQALGWEVPDLPAGTYRVRVGELERTVQIQPGAVTVLR